MKQVAIIGGGITGLTAAHVLGRAGVAATVYDAQDRPGGVIRTTAKDGFLAEHGPNSILLTSPVIMDIVHEAGLHGEVVQPGKEARNRFIVRGGAPVRLPLSPAEFITTPLFSTGAKLRLLREPFIAAAPADADESLADFVRRRIGREFLDYAINPFVAGVYAGDPERLSVRHSFPKLHALEQRYGSLLKGQILGAGERRKRAEKGKNEAGMISFTRGLQTLTDALGKSLGGKFLPRREVREIRRKPGGWEVSEGAPYDAVLYAGTAFALAGMKIAGADGADDPALSILSEVRYPPVASLVLGFPRDRVDHPLNGFGVLIPEVEPFAILGALFSSSLFPGRAPAGFVTLTCFLGGTRRPEAARLGQGEAVETALRDLRTLLGVRGEPVFVHRAFYESAIPQYEVGYGRFIDAMAAAEKRHPGLFIAGNYRDGISLGNSIVAGHDVAHRILRHLGARG